MRETSVTAIGEREIARFIVGILLFILLLGAWAWLWVPPLPVF